MAVLQQRPIILRILIIEATSYAVGIRTVTYTHTHLYMYVFLHITYTVSTLAGGTWGVYADGIGILCTHDTHTHAHTCTHAHTHTHMYT